MIKDTVSDVSCCASRSNVLCTAAGVAQVAGVDEPENCAGEHAVKVAERTARQEIFKMI
jgi:hypothetical protein